MVRVNDTLAPVGDGAITNDGMHHIIADITNNDQQAIFSESHEFNMSLDLGKLGRFRVNILQQRNNPAVVIRRIDTIIPTLNDLGLPRLLGDLVCLKRGLVIMVGATGSGKSTSLAAMIDHRNQTMSGHILTIEDPIEYVHDHKMSLITQREVGVDTKSFDIALKNSLRQKPDVILIGEIRDREVMRHVLNICETGHLALATLHANNSDQAIERISYFFENDERRQILLNLSFNFQGIISQRLVKTVDGGRAVAMEILLNTEETRQIVREGRTQDLKKIIGSRQDIGMQSFDDNLISLFHKGTISKEVAIAEADDRDKMSSIL